MNIKHRLKTWGIKTNLLQIKYLLLCMIFTGVFISSNATAASSWQLKAKQSQIGFEVSYSGINVRGEFEEFDGVVNFHPDNLSTSYIRIIVDTKSLKTNSKDTDKVIKSSAFLDTPVFPTAVFETQSISTIDKKDEKYLAHGTLTLHGITKELDLSFEASVEDNRLVASGFADVSRLDFNIGSGQWGSTTVVGENVRVVFSIEGVRN